jgi:hypothetical protein
MSWRPFSVDWLQHWRRLDQSRIFSQISTDVPVNLLPSFSQKKQVVVPTLSRWNGTCTTHPRFRSDQHSLFSHDVGNAIVTNVSTLYPNRLEEGLEAAAEICANKTCGSWIRPSGSALLAWHRADWQRPGRCNEFFVSVFVLPQLKQLQVCTKWVCAGCFDEDFAGSVVACLPRIRTDTPQSVPAVRKPTSRETAA